MGVIRVREQAPRRPAVATLLPSLLWRRTPLRCKGRNCLCWGCWDWLCRNSPIPWEQFPQVNKPWNRMILTKDYLVWSKAKFLISKVEQQQMLSPRWIGLHKWTQIYKLKWNKNEDTALPFLDTKRQCSYSCASFSFTDRREGVGSGRSAASSPRGPASLSSSPGRSLAVQPAGSTRL